MLENLIYKIENKVNGKVYIGQTRKGKRRWTQHKTELRNNRHSNEYLQNSWNKYGEDNFSFEVVEYTTKNMLDEKEIYWIEYYNSTNTEYGYNLEGGGNLNKIINEETKKKISIKNKEIMKKYQKEVYQYDLDGNLIKKYPSLHDVYGYNYKNISRVCNNERKTHDGFIWSFTELSKEELQQRIDEINDINKTNNIYQYDFDFKLIKVWDNIKECTKNGYTHSRIVNCCNNKSGSYKNNIWSYTPLTDEEIEEKKKVLDKCKKYTFKSKPVYQYDFNSMELIRKYDSIGQTREYGFCDSNVGRCCNDKIKTAGGYIWSFTELTYEELKNKINNKNKPVYQYDKNK